MKVVLLHGSSSVGKTILMKRASQEVENCAGIELDDCRYWEDYSVNPPSKRGNQLVSMLSESEQVDLTNLFEQLSAKGKRSFVFLLSELDKLFGSEVSPSWVVATCGGLPRIDSQKNFNFYKLLEEMLPFAWTNVLILIEKDEHISRIAKRGRTHLIHDIRENYSRREKYQDLHDHVISDFEGLRILLDKTVPD